MITEDEKYRTELELLVTARTEQIRTLYVTQARIIAMLNQAKAATSLSDAKAAINGALEALHPVLAGTEISGMEDNQPPRFGSEPGTPVPPVDLDDIKATLKLSREVEKDHPDGRCQIGASLGTAVCKPGANIQAIGFRLAQLGVLELLVKLGSITPETLNRLKHDGEFTDRALQAIATVPMEWMAPGVVRQGPPFDWEQFLKLCAA